MRKALSWFMLVWQMVSVVSFLHQSGVVYRRKTSRRQRLLPSSSLDNLSTEDFDRSCRIDSTIQKLREQIPFLRVKYLDTMSASEIYADSFVLLGPNNEELVTDLDELINLSATIVTATAATRQASRLARSFSSDAPTFEEDEAIVSCIMILEISNFDKMHVKWESNLFGAGTSKIWGLSEVVMNEDGLVSRHKLLDLKVGDQPVNAVGESLATLRRAIKSVQSSPLLSLATSFPLLNDIRDELLQQAATVNVRSVELPPLYAVQSLTENFNYSNNLTLIENIQSPSPLPGSSSWTHYVSVRRNITDFVNNGIPILSTGSPKEQLYDLFATECDLIGIDKAVICSGGENVAEFYRTLASIRQGTSGNWDTVGVDIDWSNRSVVVEYVASKPIRVEGKDRYFLSESNRIDAIEQLEIVVQGTKVQDPDWFRQFYQAVKAGRNAIGADIVLDLLVQVSSPRPALDEKLVGPPKLSDSAAASVYGILRALHQDLASLATLTSAPAVAYIASSIELKGYMNEVLSRGDVSYKAAIGVALLSLRGAIRSGRVLLENPPKPTISFQFDGKIRIDLVLNMRLKALPISQDIGVPIKLELISDYRFNKEGKIVEHTIIETRVNGQLTPGDVVTRFLKGTAVAQDAFPVQAVLDALNWARNIAG